ncbi:hypothetical protein SLH46_06050 [Draconibacterium sp. IB214405]|uniref:hypothetical protein n=1 Tax=Draconibacterium sp. IB214405 TaxID=3097352 RepID=UPI002A0F9227|nr:hypothetical protein [Draconibacterium sp. IB214405]MDX8338734.1 hypothetical protein [Draconibacterium sp. IB214405]
MAIDKAITFVKKATTESEFRKACYKVPSKESLMQQIGFTDVEFDDAINMQLVKCQTYEQAEVYQQIRMWFASL